MLTGCSSPLQALLPHCSSDTSPLQPLLHAFVQARLAALRVSDNSSTSARSKAKGARRKSPQSQAAQRCVDTVPNQLLRRPPTRRLCCRGALATCTAALSATASSVRGRTAACAMRAVLLCREVPTLRALLSDAEQLPSELRVAVLEDEAAVLCSLSAGSQEPIIQRWLMTCPWRAATSSPREMSLHKPVY